MILLTSALLNLGSLTAGFSCHADKNFLIWWLKILVKSSLDNGWNTILWSILFESSGVMWFFNSSRTLDFISSKCLRSVSFLSPVSNHIVVFLLLNS